MVPVLLVLGLTLAVGLAHDCGLAEPTPSIDEGRVEPHADRTDMRALAARSDANAQWLLARELLDSGAGAEDEFEGLLWLRRAAAQGHSLAQRDLGIRFELGQGVGKDLMEAFFWYDLASRRDSGHAQRRREALRPHLTQEQLDAVAARLRGWHSTTGTGQ